MNDIDLVKEVVAKLDALQAVAGAYYVATLPPAATRKHPTSEQVKQATDGLVKAVGSLTLLISDRLDALAVRFLKTDPGKWSTHFEDEIAAKVWKEDFRHVVWWRRRDAEKLLRYVAASAPATPQAGERQTKTKNAARGKWLYNECVKRTLYKEIIKALKRLSASKDWDPIESMQGMRTAANKYAKDNGKPPIPNRQNL